MDVFFEERYILSEISTSPMTSRVIDSESNILLLPSNCYAVTPEEEIIQRRSVKRPLGTSLGTPCSCGTPSSRMSRLNSAGEETPSKYSGMKQAKRRRLLMSPRRNSKQKHQSKAKKSLNITPSRRSSVSPCTVAKSQTLSTSCDLMNNCNLKEDLELCSNSQLISIIEKLVNNYPGLEEDVRLSLSSPSNTTEAPSPLPPSCSSPLPVDEITDLNNNNEAVIDRERSITELESFTRLVVQTGRSLVDAKRWPAAIQYILSSWHLVSKLSQLDESGAQRTVHCRRELVALCCHLLDRNPNLSRQSLQDLKTSFESSGNSSESSECLARISKLLETAL